MGVNLSESDRSCYRTASFKQNTIPRRGLRELRSPDQGLLISDYIQEEDSPKKVKLQVTQAVTQIQTDQWTVKALIQQPIWIWLKF